MQGSLSSRHDGEILDFSQIDAYVELEADWTNSEPVHVTVGAGDHRYSLPFLVSDEAAPHADSVAIARSPYGYSGPRAGFYCDEAIGALVDLAAAQDWAAVYLRGHPLHTPDPGSQPKLANVALHETGTVGLVDMTSDADEDVLAGHHKNVRRDIQRGRRDGLSQKVTGLDEALPRFAHIYDDAMERLGARAHLRYDLDYFTRLSDALGDVGFVVEAQVNDRVAAVALFAVVGDAACYHLSAGAPGGEPGAEHAIKLALHGGIVEAARRGATVMNLGGGVGGSQDGLWNFKRRFATREARYVTLRAVPDAEHFEQTFGVPAQEAVHQSPFPPPVP